MNKNLKKVISTVAALAISASAVSAFAVNFPDVPEDSNYYQAVQELSALDIISGFEDGTFRPDELVTRAQITKMIVDALAETAQAEASKSNSKFADVSADHWAKGYINQGVADEFIAGYSDTEFGPDDNVTYVQAQKMLVSAMGYETYAQNNGGWPNGYKMYAASQGVTDGISGIADDQQLTRAQVARLLDNAMNSPVCVIDDYETLWNGTVAPKLKIKDGEGKEWQTLFTKKHDAYKVYGRVTATSKTTDMDTDKVEFRVEKADNYDDTYVKAGSVADDAAGELMYFGDTNANDLVNTYAQALVQKNDNDEWTILSIVPAAASKTVTVLAEDVDDNKSNVDNKVLYFYPAGTTRNSVKYELADTVSLYVNGKAMGTFTQADYVKYIQGNDSAIVTLQKTTDSGKTSTGSAYNMISITYYSTAVVRQVLPRTDETRINFKKYANDIKASMTVELDTDDKTYSFKLNGEEIDPADLQEDDVLSISYDVNDFANSNFYEVLVSRDTAEGKYTGKNSDSTEYTFGGTKYEVAAGMKIAPETSTEYTLYLDAYGKVAYIDEISDTKNIGILKRVYEKSNGDNVAEIITKDGKVVEYDVDDGDVADFKAVRAGAYVQADVLADYPTQVIEYKVSSSGKATVKKAMPVEQVSGGTDAAVDFGEYKASSNKIGSIKISDATTIIDISNAAKKKDDIKVLTSLKDGTEYKAYGYDKSSSDSSYRFVIVVDGDQGINSTSQLAVFIESGSDENDEGNDTDTMTVLVNNEKATYFVDEDATYAGGNTAVDVKDFKEGDLLVFSTNSAGDIDEVQKVMSLPTTYRAFFDAIKGGTVLETADWKALLSDGDEDDVNVRAGAVVDVTGDTYTVAAVDANGKVNLDAKNQDITINADTKIFTYNYKGRQKDAGRITWEDGMQVTPEVDSAYPADGNGGYNTASSEYDLTVTDLTDYDKDDTQVVFAIVRTFDGDDAQEVYLIVAN